MTDSSGVNSCLILNFFISHPASQAAGYQNRSKVATLADFHGNLTEQSPQPRIKLGPMSRKFGLPSRKFGSLSQDKEQARSGLGSHFGRPGGHPVQFSSVCELNGGSRPPPPLPSSSVVCFCCSVMFVEHCNGCLVLFYYPELMMGRRPKIDFFDKSPLMVKPSHNFA